MPKALALYQIPEAYRDIMDKIADQEGECTDEDLAALDAIEGTLEDRVDHIGAVIAECDATVEFFKPELDRITKRIRGANRHTENLKKYLKETMAKLEREKVQGKIFRARIQRNSAPSIDYKGQPEKLPKQYQRIKIETDKDAIKTDWKAGFPLPEGITVELGNHLRIE